MNKNAFVEVEVISVAIIAIILIFFVIALSGLERSVVEVDTIKGKINNDLFLINLLRTKESGFSLQDYLINGYFKNDLTESKKKIDIVFEEAFDESLCWKITLKLDDNERYVETSSECTHAQDLELGKIDAFLSIPVKDKESIKAMNITFESI